MADEYKVTHTQPYTYQSPEGRLIAGYRIWFRVLAFDEVFYADVPAMDPAAIKRVIESMVAGRKALG